MQLRAIQRVKHDRGVPTTVVASGVGRGPRSGADDEAPPPPSMERAKILAGLGDDDTTTSYHDDVGAAISRTSRGRVVVSFIAARGIGMECGEEIYRLGRRGSQRKGKGRSDPRRVDAEEARL